MIVMVELSDNDIKSYYNHVHMFKGKHSDKKQRTSRN